MTPADHALVQNILDDPLNDGIEGPRGVYADWLDERGHGNDRERAAFIRDQIYGEYVEPKVEWIEDMARTIYGPSAKPCVDYGYSGGKNGVTWEWVRGFPAQLSCTLATLFGGKCGTCRGVVIVDELPEQEANYSYCPECKNSGRTAGIARDVFSRWPLVEVRLTDREPLQFTPDQGSSSFQYEDRFSWGRVGGLSLGGGEYWLPDAIWNFIQCDDMRVSRYKQFPTHDAALAALSRAAVNYGRERAGLRPIAWVNS